MCVAGSGDGCMLVVAVGLCDIWDSNPHPESSKLSTHCGPYDECPIF